MALNPLYVLQSDLESLFRDKNGLPLRAGKLFFFQDINRTNPKDVFMLSGNPPDYTYTNLGPVIILTGSGTIGDPNNPGNDILLYYFPWDGDENTTTGTQDLYFVQAYDSGDEFQWSRAAWPNTPGGAAENDYLINKIQNPQFRLHTNLPNKGLIASADTIIAPGNWYFETNTGLGSVDYVTFSRFGSYTANPPGNPRYAVVLQNTSAGSGVTNKDLGVWWNNVNTFASDTNYWTFGFAAQSKNSSSIIVDAYVVKNFGTGGSTQTTTIINTLPIVITPTYTFFTIPFIFGDNSGMTIGPYDDDFVSIIIRMPLGGSGFAAFTDFILTPGNVTMNGFPATTENEMLLSLVGSLPIPDPIGFTLGLPITDGPGGFQYDYSQVGKVFVSVTAEPQYGELFTDGAQYDSLALSPDRIPYGRLGSALFDTSVNLPVTGTGLNYFTNYIMQDNATILRTVTNINGAVSAFADHGTTFTATILAVGGAISGLQGYKTGVAQILVRGLLTGGTTNNAVDGSPATGFGIAQILTNDGTINQAPLHQIFTIETIAASGITPGAYFIFGNTTLGYYMWFTINGVGTDPAPGGGLIGIKVALLSTYTADDVSNIIREIISGYSVTLLQAVAQSAITAGTYFILYSTTQVYVVWFTINGIGTAPIVTGSPVLINVNIPAASTTAAQVATQTQLMLNKRFFQTPDFRGKFLRSRSHSSGWDPDVTARLSNSSVFFGDNLLTLQLDEIVSHYHFITASSGAAEGVTSNPSAGIEGAANTWATGGKETRPVNAYVNMVIKY